MCSNTENKPTGGLGRFFKREGQKSRKIVLVVVVLVIYLAKHGGEHAPVSGFRFLLAPTGD